MLATKAYILKIDTPISKEYSEICAESCKNINLKYEFFNGYTNQTGASALGQTGIKKVPSDPYEYVEDVCPNQKAMCCTAGHFSIWKIIAEGSDEAAIVLEHDAIMLQPIEIDIPDGVIVVLGYKLTDPSRYDHETAGAPKELIDIPGHQGAHAYAMTKKTAQFLIEEIETQGINFAVDNDYFLTDQRRTAVPLKIASPTPALVWLRESTIWEKTESQNYEFIASFKENYK